VVHADACEGQAAFDVVAGQLTPVSITLVEPAADGGSASLVGEAAIDAVVPVACTANSLQYTVQGPNGYDRESSVANSPGGHTTFRIGHLPANEMYTITLASGTCMATADFEVSANGITQVALSLAP
jgi:hypothetical protein